MKFCKHSNKKQSIAQNERGATMLEYGVMVALICVASIVAIKGLGETINNSFIEVQLAQGGVLPL